VGLSFLIVNLGVPRTHSYQINQCSHGIVLKGKHECHRTHQRCTGARVSEWTPAGVLPYLENKSGAGVKQNF